MFVTRTGRGRHAKTCELAREPPKTDGRHKDTSLSGKHRARRGPNGLSGLVQVSLVKKKQIGKSPQNSPIQVGLLIFWSSIPCVFCLYALLKVVGYYDLTVLSMSVMGLKKNWDGVGG